jgi:hypothetical protein
MNKRIEREEFDEVLNTQFRIPVENSDPLKLELFEITEGLCTPTQEQFALHFRGPLEMPFPQAIRQLEHDTLGTLTLFLVPIGKNEQCMIYEAAFNRFIQQDEA